MKALIISEEQNVCNSLNAALEKSGYDTIVYKWLLKALDNIEEIRPDCIIVSSSEYPRHWKTLVQFVKSGIGGENVKIYLYEPNPMTTEDEEKARILGISGYFTSLDASVLEGIFDKEKKDSIETNDFQNSVTDEVETESETELIQNEEPLPTVNSIDSPIEQTVRNSGYFMFTHPFNQKFVAGRYFDFNGKTMSCTFQNINDICGLEKNDIINSFTFFDSLKTINAKVIVHDILKISEDNIIFVIEISDIYEEV